MKSEIFLITVLLLLRITTAQNTAWKEPYFIDPKNGIVEFGKVEGEHQLISMEEEVEPNVTLAYLNYKEKSPEPIITKFDEGSPDIMGPVFVYDEKKEMWSIVITNQIDYEILTGRKRFMFSVAAQGVQKKIALTIINIDDNEPVVEILTYPCQIEENFIGESDCVYRLSDADGWLSYMDFQISGEKNESDIFKFRYNDIGSLTNSTYSTFVKLHTIKELDFETISVYLFDWIVIDSGANKVTTKILVKVIDMPDMPPRWTKIFATQQFLEKVPQTFEVTAIDGDLEVNAPINYKLNSEWNELFNINTETGVITTVPNGIDRDAMKREIFTFEIIAYEKDDPNWKETQSVSFIVDDVNDNPPKINTSNEEIWGTDHTLRLSIEEAKISPINTVIEIEDRDLGVNAMYEVSLIDGIANMYTEPFQIIPKRGYQQGNFSLAIVDSILLDYEDEKWRKFKFEIFVEEDEEKSHFDRAYVEIQLINWNDELPEFDQSEYIFEVPENIKKNQFVALVHATDRDVDDYVVYELLGTAVNNILEIGKQSGEVKTTKDNAFDYERQTQVIVQVQAQDNLGGIHHKTFAQLIIDVLDVNDETPKIQVPSRIEVKENRDNGTLITDEITATDEDTTAHLSFTIDWSSSYALKNGQRVKEINFSPYIESVYVETVNISTNPTGYARADLKIFEKVPKNTPDYEIFDILYLKLTVTDLNQEIGDDSASVVLTINIIDLNDNPPEFEESTTKKNFTVLEQALLDTLVGTITAIDPDGPPHNNVSYFIEPVDKDTPDNWIEIDQLTGSLSVINTGIDADKPLWYLKYTVTATDGELNATDDIAIFIIDRNNKQPKIEHVDSVIYIKEKSDIGTVEKTKIEWSDADRDPPHNEVWFTLRNANENVRNFFKIDEKTGDIIVNNGNLDRDYGIQEFTVDFEAVDNYPGGAHEQLSDKGTFKIKLLDINDQTPVVQTKSVTTSETLEKGKEIPEKIHATDDDEPGNPNSKIEFAIVDIKKGEDGAAKDPPPDLFSITSNPEIENGIAILLTNYNLEGYYGQYNLTLKVNDLGKPPNTAHYPLIVNVEKHNFREPVFIIPPNATKNVYYLSKSNTVTSSPLILYNNEYMKSIKADDRQGGKWDIQFSIVEDSSTNEAHTIFHIDNRNSLGQSTGELQLKTDDFDKSKRYDFTILANDRGKPEYTATSDVTIYFFDIGQQPQFSEDDRIQTVAFTENVTGLSESQEIRQASYNGIENFNVYYLLTPSDDSKYFAVDILTGKIILQEELDYEMQKSHVIQIVASNSRTIPSTDPESKLELTVNVIDVNDNAPYFNSTYFGIITSDKEINDKVLTVVAYDEDEDDYLSYTIIDDSLETNGTGINELSKPFEISEMTGEVSIKFKVLQSMNGYFKFTVEAVDKPPELHAATTSLKIFIVSEKHRIEFKFETALDIIEQKNATIIQILQENFGYVCNIEKIVQDADANGEPLNNQTVVITYFIDDSINEPVLKEVIINKASDIDEFTKLKARFLLESMLLLGFNTEIFDNNQEGLLMAWLIGVTVVLGSLCLVLLVAFIVKTRSLTNRLNNLSNIKFGSQESGINRIGVTAPTTNKHAVEGSNPVFNEEKKMPDIDRRSSIASGDSDLIGVEDNPEFDYSPHLTNKEK